MMAAATKARSKAPSRSAIGRVELMLEHLSDKMDLLIETVGANRDEAKRDLAELRQELVARLDVLESVVREHSRILGEHSRILDEHGRLLHEHSAELQAIRGEIGQMVTRGELLRLESRVIALETRLG